MSSPQVLHPESTSVLRAALNPWNLPESHLKSITDFKSLLYKPTHSRKRNPTFLCKSATEDDLKTMYGLWKVFCEKQSSVQPYKNISSFAYSYCNTPGISLDETLLIYEERNLLAMMSICNLDSNQRILMDSENVLMNIASRFFRLPKTGEELKILYGFQHAFSVDHPNISEAAQTMILKARNIAFERRAHFFSLGMNLSDPLLPVASRTAIMSNSALMN